MSRFPRMGRVLEVEDDALVVCHPRFAEAATLTPGSERDRFSGTFPIGELAFVRNEAGDVHGLDVGNGRSRGILFWRTEADDPRRVP